MEERLPERAPSAPSLIALPVHSVRARNLFRESENRIHDDAVARSWGYAAGLIAGTTVYAYMTSPLVAAWGTRWLERGTATVRLLRPIYEGEDVRLEARVVARSGRVEAGEEVCEVSALTGPGAPAATGVAGVAWGGPLAPPDPAAYPRAPLPASRPAAVPEELRRVDVLGSTTLDLDPTVLTQYADDVEDPHDIYRGASAVAHPGLLLQQANRILSANVALGPWVHASSSVTHWSVARGGERLVTRGRVARVFEKKGHDYVELDLLMAAGGDRPALQVRHTAIYRLRPPEA